MALTEEARALSRTIYWSELKAVFPDRHGTLTLIFRDGGHFKLKGGEGHGLTYYPLEEEAPDP